MSVNPLFYVNNITKPTIYEIDNVYSYDDGMFDVRSRTEWGWTLDFIFSGYSGTTGNTFFYLGLLDEFDVPNYIDNNLSFDFTVDGRVRWKKMSYSNPCLTGHTTIEVTDKTPVLCPDGISSDFNITIVFERNLKYDGCCEMLNEGGENDLFTGWTLSNPYEYVSVTTGQTEPHIAQHTTIWTINPKWYKERFKRLGTLKIYLNGRVIYKMKNWEEVIPTHRQSINKLVQSWGGGTTGSGGIHNGINPFVIKRIAYYEVPLKFVDVRNNYLELSSIYDITECRYDCGEYHQAPSSTPTPTPTETPVETPTPAPTPSPLPYYTYLISDFTFDTTYGACAAESWMITGYSLAPDLGSLVGYTMYTDTNLSVPYNGHDTYNSVTDITQTVIYSVIINTTGQINSSAICP